MTEKIRGKYLPEKNFGVLESHLLKNGPIGRIIPEDELQSLGLDRFAEIQVRCLKYISQVIKEKPNIYLCFVECNEFVAFAGHFRDLQIVVFTTEFLGRLLRDIDAVIATAPVQEMFGLESNSGIVTFQNYLAINTSSLFNRTLSGKESLIFLLASEIAISLITFHEVTHLVHGHIGYINRDLDDKILSQCLEHQADRLAVTYLADLVRISDFEEAANQLAQGPFGSAGIVMVAILSMLHLEGFSGPEFPTDTQTHTHPPSRFRIRSCLYLYENLLKRRHPRYKDMADEISIAITRLTAVPFLLWKLPFSEEFFSNLKNSGEHEQEYAQNLDIHYSNIRHDLSNNYQGALKGRKI